MQYSQLMILHKTQIHRLKFENNKSKSQFIVFIVTLLIAHIIWNRKRIMKENSMDRARRATFIASGQVAKMKAERAAKKEAVERVQNVAKSSL